MRFENISRACVTRGLLYLDDLTRAAHVSEREGEKSVGDFHEYVEFINRRTTNIVLSPRDIERIIDES